MMETQAGAELCFPQLLNSSCKKPTPAWSEVVFLHFLLSCVSVLTVALNMLIIISVSHFRQLHKPTNLLILSLSVSDFLVGLVFLPGEILRKTGCWFLGELMCSLYKYIITLNVSASVGNMVLISADRHVAICDPLHYPTRVTVRRARICISLCWLCSGLFCSLFVKNDQLQNNKNNFCDGQCVFSIDYTLGAVDVVFNFVLPITLIVVLYMRVFVVAVSQARAMRSHITAVTLQRSVTVKTKKSELKAARTLGVVVAVFLMCYCPYYCASLVWENLLNTSFGTFVVCVFSLNPCLNPLIYALFYRWFRKTVKLIVTLQILQPGSREANIL